MSYIAITTNDTAITTTLVDLIKTWTSQGRAFEASLEVLDAAPTPDVKESPTVRLPYAVGATVTLKGDKFRIVTTVKAVSPAATDGKVVKLHGGSGYKLVDGRWVPYTLKTISLTQADIDAGKLLHGVVDLQIPAVAPDVFGSFHVGQAVVWTGRKYIVSGTVKKIEGDKLYITPSATTTQFKRDADSATWNVAKLKTVSITREDLRSGVGNLTAA